MPPLGLAYIASALRQAGHQVELLDAYVLGWSWDRFAAHMARSRPEVLGLSTMTPVSDIAARAAALARPHAGRIVLGGPHATAIREAVFDEMPTLDAAVIGEGEDVAVALLSWWDHGTQGPPPPGALVPGQPFVAHTPRADLGSLPWPARDLLPNASYRYLFATRPGLATVITSRGCPFRCTFCDKSVSGSRWRARDAVDVVDELEYIVAQLGIHFVNFYDDNFTLKRRRVVEICEEILRRGLDLEWKCEGRVDSVDADLLALMRRAGCSMVAYGVESGNPETLALLRKDVTINQTRQAFAATRAAGLRTLAYVILGAPGEDQEAVLRTVRFCHEIGATYVQFSTLTAMPGTPLFSTHGRASTQDLSLGAPGGVRNPVDGDLHRATITDLPPDQLARLLRTAWVGFYLRPRPIGRVLRDAIRSGSVPEALRLGQALGRWARPAWVDALVAPAWLRRSAPATTP
ncbi:MAG: B12-binding domain-containing radical SAM protein [Oligoflexia bacterium]|nr:B12-binding domain-containing radical SAM protein [Oligoflexia bacterium]